MDADEGFESVPVAEHLQSVPGPLELRMLEECFRLLAFRKTGIRECWVDFDDEHFAVSLPHHLERHAELHQGEDEPARLYAIVSYLVESCH